MEEKNEKVVEETTNESTENVEEVKKPETNEHGDFVINMDKPKENETKQEAKEDNTYNSGVVELVEDATTVPEQEEVQQEDQTQETSVLEEVKEDEKIVEEKVEELETKIENTVVKPVEKQEPLPEDIQKLVDFMQETGGDLNDYVKLNKDYSKLDDSELLYEYYKQTKPHLNIEEINFLLEDRFSFDEDVDEEIEIKRKQSWFKAYT